MLKVPFKVAETISFAKPLKQAIQNVFEEDPETYEEDFDELASLRLTIQDPQDHEASAQSHLTYYAQLQYLETKFKFDEDNVNVFFSWRNAFGLQECVSSHLIGFEKASVLFNLAAIYNHLGIQAGTANDDCIKKSAQFFQVSLIPSFTMISTALIP